MVETLQLVTGAILLAIGALLVYTAWRHYQRYRTASRLETDDHGLGEPGSETTVSGRVQVEEPASPERTMPDPPENADPPAVWAWRVRRKEARGRGRTGSTGRRGGSRHRWRTIDGGLATGKFAIESEWEHVSVDTASLIDNDGAVLGEEDPFEADSLFLDGPQVDVPLGDLDPITAFLTRRGIIGEDGLLGDVELTISFGRSTMTPDHYQATIVRDGEELLASGELTETADGYRLAGTVDTPLVLAAGDLTRTGAKLRRRSLTTAVAGALFVVAGIVVVGVGIA